MTAGSPTPLWADTASASARTADLPVHRNRDWPRHRDPTGLGAAGRCGTRQQRWCGGAGGPRPRPESATAPERPARAV